MANETEQPQVTPALYNTRTRKPETVPVDQIEDAISSGTHSYPAGTQINVVDPSGQAGSVASEDLPHAIAAGYKVERPSEYAVRKYVEENAGASGTVKAFGRKLVDELGMGIPGVLEEKLGDPLEVAKARALAKQHEIASIGGGVLGFGGSLLYGGPLFKGAAKAGELVARPVAAQVAAGLAKLGMKSGTKAAAANIVAKAAEKATQLGVEGAVISSPKAVTEGMLGDPEQAAETLLVGGGIGAAMGLPMGIAGQTFKEIGKSAGRVAAAREAQALAKAGQEVPQELAAQAAGEAEATSSPLEIFQRTLEQKKPNAQAIEAAAQAEGVPLFPGVTEGSQFIRDAAENLSHRPTLPGVMFQEDVQKTYDALQGSAERMVGKVDDAGAADITRARAGQAAKDAIKSEIGTKLEDFSDRYGALDEKIGGFATDPHTSEKLIAGVKKNEIFGLKSQSALAAEANRYLEDLSNASDLSQVSRIRTLISEAETKALRAADNSAARVFKEMKQAATELRQRTIDENIRLMGLKGAEGRQGAEMLRRELAATDSEYAEFKRFVGDISGELKIRGRNNQRQVLEALEAISPDQLANKMFNVKNQKALQFFAKHFPQAFENLKQVYLQDLRQAAARDGRFNFGTLVRRVDALEPEVRAMVLGEEGAQRFKNFKTLVEALPGPANPSKTSYAQAFGRVFSAQGVVDTASDLMTYTALKNKDRVAGLLKTEKAMKAAAERLDKIPDVLDSASGAARSGSAGIWNDQKALAALIRLFDQREDGKTEKPKTRRAAFKEASEIIQKHAIDPEHGSQRPALLVRALQQTGAPQIGNQLGMKVSVALQYLNAELPRPFSAPGVLNKTAFEPSDAQIAQFERKLSVVMDPLTIMDDVKAGTLTRDHVQAIQAVYPKLYQQMQHRVLQWSTDQKAPIPYPVRLRLSLFMGMPLDTSTNPSTIAGLQSTFAMPDHQEAAQQEMRAKLTIADQTVPDTQKKRGNRTA